MANQIIIDIGAVANDGTGDPLRTAFNYVNDNFSNIWATGVANSNVAFDGNKILTANTNGNLILAPNGIGKVQSNVDIRPNANNTLSLGSSALRWNSVYTQNLDVGGNVSFADLTVNGNLTVSGNIIEMGNIVTDAKTIQLANTANTTSSANGSGITVGANDNIATMLYNSTSNAWTVNIGVSAVGNITAPYFIGNGSQLTGLPATYSNTNATALLASFGSNTISTTGNITAGYFVGNGALLTGIATSSLGNLSVVGSAIQLATGAPNTSVYLTANGVSGNAYVRIPSNPTTLSDGLSIVNLHGRVEIKAKDGAASQSWYFQEDGSLQLPGDVPAHIASDNNIVFQTGSGDHWILDTAGVLTTPGNIIPDTSNVYSLGNSTNQWKDLWVSNATIYMDSVPISLTAGNVLTVNGNDVVTTNANGTVDLANLAIDNNNIYNTQGQGVIISNFNYVTAEAETAYVNIPAGNSPGELQIVQEQGDVRITANAASWSFNADNSFKMPNNANITVVDNVITQINAVATANSAINLRTFDANGNVGASTFFDGSAGTLDFYSFNYTTDNSYNWRFDNGGSFTLPNAPGNIYFGEDANQPVIIPEGVGITLSANRADAAVDYISVNQNGIDLFSVNNINIDNSTTGLLGTDINIRSGDDIFLRGRNKPDDSENEGGDINFYAGQGANAVTLGNDTGGGGDIQIYAGAGGIATYSGTGGSSGGYVEILGGDGGTSVDSFVGSGGSLTLAAGSAGTPADPANGGYGGGVSISAGTTTRVNESGGSIELTTGGSTGLGYGAAGYLAINIPESNVGPGGSWTFSGSGTTFQVPANSEIYGANFGNFTVGCAGNTIVTSSDYGANVKNWVFGYTGNLLAPGNIITPTNFVGTSLRTNLADFNWSANITNMNTGINTIVVLDRNVFGDPWSGQITISDVTGATEANATWWYQATNQNSIELFTDSTFTTPVDSSAWGTYTGGGFAVTIDYGNVQINAQNITIQSGQADYSNKVWSFNSNGSTQFPTLTVNLHNGGNQNAQTLQFGNPDYQAVITGPTPTGGSNAQRLIIQGQNGGTGEGGDVYVWGGDADTNGGDIKIYAGDADNGGGGYGGYINIDGGSGFNSGGPVEITGGQSTGSQGAPVRIIGGYGQTSGGDANISGGQGGNDHGGNVNVTAGYGANIGGAVNIIGGGSGLGLPGYGNVGISAGASSWAFDNAGTLTFPSLANISGGNLNGGTASATVALNAFSPSGDTVSIQAQGNTSSAVISIFANAGPVTSNWTFTTSPLDPTESYLYVPGGAAIVTPEATGGAAGKNIFIEAGYADQTTYSTSAGGELFLKGGRGATNDGGGGGQGGNVNINAGESTDPAGHAGNIYVTAGALQQWVFDYTGTLTAPGNITTTGNISVGNILAQNIRTIEGTVHVGQGAGLTNQGSYAIAMGRFAGSQDQGAAGLAIGQLAGQTNQGQRGVAIGYYSAANTQSANAVAIGTYAGRTTQGANAIAIGALAGNNNQSADSIILNATGDELNSTNSGFYVAPIRNDVANIGNIAFYNTTSKEITYGNTISVAGNITGGNLITTGIFQAANISATANITGGNLVVTDATSFLASATGNDVIGTNKTTGNIFIGGSAQTGQILIGQSTQSQLIQIAGASTASGNVKTVSIGQNAASGSITNINIGPTSGAGGTGTVTFSDNIRLTVGNTSSTALSVAGNIIGGNLRTNGQVSAAGNITGGNISVSGNITGNTAGFAIGYRDVPQITFSANANAVLTDAGKHYYSTTAGNLALTLPDNSTTAFPTGTAMTIVVQAAGNVLVNAGTGVTLYMGGNSTSGNRVVGPYGMATVMKVAANVWFINGTGVS